MKKLLFALLISLPLFSQTTVIQRPDCILPLGLITTASTNIGPFDNRTTGCNTWVIDYTSFGFTVLSLVVQTAPNATGNIPGAWSTFTAVTGINPNTAITQAVSTFGGTTSYFPWVRVQLTSVTGTGSISGVLYGWKIPAAPPGGSGCIGTIATPCVVVGPTADGAPPTTSPVLVAGQDGSNIQTLKTDTTGRPEVVGPAADGAAVAGAPVRVGGKDGSGNTQDIATDTAGNSQVVGPAASGAAISGNPVNVGTSDGVNIVQPFICTSQALFNLSASGNTEIIAASGSTLIRICHLSFSTTAAEDIKVTRGTGANCGSGTTDVTGLYKSIQSAVFDWGPNAALRGAASGAICINQSAAQALGGIVIYAQF